MTKNRKRETVIEKKHPHLPGDFLLLFALKYCLYIIYKMLENIYVQFYLDLFMYSFVVLMIVCVY